MGLTMSEPRRHNAGDRNRRKALRQIDRVLSELEHLHNRALRSLANFRYAIDKAGKLKNRLKSEYKRTVR